MGDALVPCAVHTQRASLASQERTATPVDTAYCKQPRHTSRATSKAQHRDAVLSTAR
jgi:hypothetical protein